MYGGGSEARRAGHARNEERRRPGRSARSGAEIRGRILLTLACIRIATPEQLRRLLLPQHQGTDYVRRALRDLARDRLVSRVQHAQQSVWHLTPAGVREAALAGEGPDRSSRATGEAAAKTGLRRHGLAVTDTAVAFHATGAAHVWDWEVEVTHPAPGRRLVTDAVVHLTSGAWMFVEIDRNTMSQARLLDKTRSYVAYMRMPPSSRGNAARAPRAHWEHTYGDSIHRYGPGFPRLLWIVTGAERGNPELREDAYLQAAQQLPEVRLRRVSVAITTLALLQRHGPAGPVWRCADRPDDPRVALDDIPPPAR